MGGNGWGQLKQVRGSENRWWAVKTGGGPAKTDEGKLKWMRGS